MKYREMYLTGPGVGKWDKLSEETANRMLAMRGAPGSVYDWRADIGRYIERSDGGPWETFSYWSGSNDFYPRARQLEIDQIEGQARRLNREAQDILAGADATIDGYRNQIAAAEAGLKQAQEDKKRDQGIARNKERQASALVDRVEGLRREMNRRPPVVEAVTA